MRPFTQAMLSNVRSFVYPISLEPVQPLVIPSAQLQRIVWGGLISETVYVGLSLARVGAGLSPLVSVPLAVMFLVLFPGCVASVLLEVAPSLAGSILFGFTAFGGLTLLSQLLHISSIYPTVAIHLAWQLAVCWWLSRHRLFHAVKLPRPHHLFILVASLLVMAGFAIIVHAAAHLEFTDQWYHIQRAADVMDHLGAPPLPGAEIRANFSAGDSLMAWLATLVNIRPFQLALGWDPAALALAAAVGFAIVVHMERNPFLAAAAAWLTALALITSTAFPSLGATLTMIMPFSDKWIALVLLVPLALVVLIRQLDQRFTWRTAGIALIAPIAPMLYHPHGLLVVAWLMTVYLVVDFVLGARNARHLIALAFGAILCFVFVPVVYPLVYANLPPLVGSLASVSLAVDTYVPLTIGAYPPGQTIQLFIPSPGLLVAPLLISPLVFILIRGPRRTGLQQLFFSWTWAVFLLYIPPFANFADRLWFPVFLDRFAWTLPFGAMTAVGLWFILAQRKWLFVTCIALLSVGLVAVVDLQPVLDPGANQLPVVNADMVDLLNFFRSQHAANSVVLTPLPGPQTLIVGDDVAKGTVYGFPDIKKLYAMPWWGAQTLTKYLIGQVDWLVMERNSTPLFQVELQPSRYRLAYENTAYLVYHLTPDFKVTPIDQLLDKLLNLGSVTPADVPAFDPSDAYAQVIVGLAYRSLGRCVDAVQIHTRSVAQNAAARATYLETLAVCNQTDTMRQTAAEWRDDPQLSATLLSGVMVGMLDSATVETAVQHWLLRPNYNRDELATTRTVASALAVQAGRPDLAAKAMSRLPDVVLEPDDWLAFANWSALAGHSDPTLYRRANRNDLALLLEGQVAMSGEPARARGYFQAAVDDSHRPEVYLFLAQSCQATQNYVCAQTAYAHVAAMPNEPLAAYAAALSRAMTAENPEAVLDSQACQIARGLSLSCYEGAPPPVLLPLTPGQVSGGVLVSATWHQPLTGWSANRLLDVTLSNPLPAATTVHGSMDINGFSPTTVALYIPANVSIRYSIPVAVPVMSSTPNGLYTVTLWQNNYPVRIADMPSWLPPRTTISGAAKPLAVFGNGLQLLDASTHYVDGRAVLSLIWQPTQPIPDRYTLFLHLYDSTGKVIGIQDAPPFNGAYPTDSWIVNYPFQIDYPLNVDAVASIRLGWYLSPDGPRLRLQGGPDSANNEVQLPLGGARQDQNAF